MTGIVEYVVKSTSRPLLMLEIVLIIPGMWMLLTRWRAQDKARELKEQEEVAKAELHLSGNLAEWK